MKFTTLLLVSFFCFLSSSPLSCHARQQDALTRLFNAKFKKTADIDVNCYEEVDYIDESKVLSQVGLKENDRIEKLPGQPEVNFTQYGGYVTVSKKNGRAFYYYFTEAERLKESKPLLVWLNGGPGCSSLAYGAMEELGPFRVNSDGKTLYKNPYAWNKVANVLYVESPAGVGFSYTNTSSDIGKSGDKMTAKDNYVFLVNWLERYPEYKDRDIYLSGESYAGHYVPQFAHQILMHNKKANKTIVNLKGIIIGNAVIHDETDNTGMYDYFWTHALISDEVHSAIEKYCDFSLNDTTPQLPQCDAATQESNKNTFDVIDIYNLYGPLCHNQNLTATPKKPSLIIDPCSAYYTYAYLNRQEVQKALHANVTKMSYDWQPCSDVINKWNDSPRTILPLLREFMANGLRVWVFSGDTDGRVPVTSTRYSLNKLKLPVKGKFRPWFVGGEVGGYTEVYKGDITFATVRGAGHEVPSYQPQRALSLIKHFLTGTPLPLQ